MDRHGSTPFPAALDLPLSLTEAYLQSPVHKHCLKVEEARHRGVEAVIGRIDAVIRSVGNLGRALSGMSR